MPTYLLIIHMLIALCLVGLILIQRSEGGGLGIGGGVSDIMGSRGVGNILTRVTAWLAAIFMASSLTLTMISNRGDDVPSILDIEDEEFLDFSPSVPLDGLLDVRPSQERDDSFPLLKDDKGQVLPAAPPIE